jgi:SAM-dependent methyltransferase
LTNEKVAADCRVCGGAPKSRFATADARYARCGRCGTVQKLMSAAEYQAMDPGYDPGSYLAAKSEDEIRAFLWVDDARKVLADICAQHGIDPKGKSYLDVGCGMGGYMLAARDLGMSVRGFEPSVSHGTVAIDVLKLPVERAYYSSDKVLPEQFDLILLSHVIEHIYDPAPFVADLIAALKPEGILVMVTPNAGALIARVLGKEWPMLVPVDHVTMLTPQAVPHLLPAGYTARVRTSEYPFEMLATIGSVVKRALRGRATNHSDMEAPEAPRLMQTPSLRGRIVRLALTLGSLPSYWLAGMLNKRAALEIVVRRQPGA